MEQRGITLCDTCRQVRGRKSSKHRVHTNSDKDQKWKKRAPIRKKPSFMVPREASEYRNAFKETGEYYLEMARKAAKSSATPEQPKLFYIFYNQERWDNWLNSLKEANFEFAEGSEEVPDGLRILDSFSEDITLEVLKVVKLYQNRRFTKEEADDKLSQVEKIVMCEAPQGELEEIIEMLQLSKLVLFAACRKYLGGNYDRDMKSLVKKGRDLVEKDMEVALDLAAQVGANVIDGTPCCRKFLKDEPEQLSLFDEWLIECERMSEAISSLKNFDEEAGEEY